MEGQLSEWKREHAGQMGLHALIGVGGRDRVVVDVPLILCRVKVDVVVCEGRKLCRL